MQGYSVCDKLGRCYALFPGADNQIYLMGEKNHKITDNLLSGLAKKEYLVYVRQSVRRDKEMEKYSFVTGQMDREAGLLFGALEPEPAALRSFIGVHFVTSEMLQAKKSKCPTGTCKARKNLRAQFVELVKMIRDLDFVHSAYERFLQKEKASQLSTGFKNRLHKLVSQKEKKFTEPRLFTLWKDWQLFTKEISLELIHLGIAGPNSDEMLEYFAKETTTVAEDALFYQNHVVVGEWHIPFLKKNIKELLAIARKEKRAIVISINPTHYSQIKHYIENELKEPCCYGSNEGEYREVGRLSFMPPFGALNGEIPARSRVY